MEKNRDAVTRNGRAAFYAAMWDDIRQCAMDCGWAVAIHGSLNSGVDILAMPWVREITCFPGLVERITGLVTGSTSQNRYYITYGEKPYGRAVATIPVWGDFYLYISAMETGDYV